jgi:hypothetical protein
MTTSQKSKCPYCLTELDDTPKRKTKCLKCGKVIFVRKGQLVTEEEAYITDELVRLARFDITRKDFDKYRQILAKQFGSTPSVNDTLWRIFNDQLAKTQNPDWYYEMARLVSSENKDPQPYIKQALGMSLGKLKEQGVKTVRVAGYGMISDDSSCPACQALHGQKFAIDVAINEMPIPTMCQNKTGCRCSYVSERVWKDFQS